ncbi:MAG: SpoIIE family protein phosphatase [Bacteroidota bacterium]
MRFTLHIAAALAVSLCWHALRAQNTARADSLRDLIKAEQADTARFELMMKLAEVYRQADVEQSVIYLQQAAKLGDQLRDHNRSGLAWKTAGNYYMNSGRYEKAIDCYVKSYACYEKTGNKSGMAANLINMGTDYMYFGNYDKAKEYCEKGLKLALEIDHKLFAGNAMITLASIFGSKGDRDKQMQMYRDVIALHESMGESRNVMVIGLCNSNIGSIYVERGQYDSALFYLEKGLQPFEQAKDPNMCSAIYSDMSEVWLSRGNLKKAESYGLLSLQEGQRSGNLLRMNQSNYVLSKVYEKKGDIPKAFAHFKESSKYRDSIFSKDKGAEFAQKEARFMYERKAMQDSLRLLGEAMAIKAKADEKQKKQNVITISLISGLALLLVLAFVMYRGSQAKRRAHRLISMQKDILEQKNREITDSLSYAQKIQEAILPPEKLWKQHLPESFVFYKPKDIVAGDFYWMETADNKILFAAGDCTGHGVPGAMVSVICSDALNRAVKEFGLTEPGKILDKTTQLVLETFAKSESEVKDGMDISLCCLDRSTRQLTFAGANNPLWLLRDRTINEVPADKQPVGKYDRPRPFTTHSLKLNPGETVYLFTDGYADQFGGEKGKKFKYARLERLLMYNAAKAMQEQKDILASTFENWKGALEQVDDVCLIGIRV